MTIPIRIMTLDFELITEIDQYASLQLTRSWYGVGSADLHINRHIRGADELTRGRIIFPHNKLNKAYIIRHREIELDENGKATENWIIKAFHIESWFTQRITLPPPYDNNPTTAYDTKQADAETVMRHYIEGNCMSPFDHTRHFEHLALSPNKNQGENVSWRSRYKILAEELAEIGFLGGLGWTIEVDTALKKYVVKMSEGRDLTAGQNILPPAIFSPEFGTLGSLSYTESDLDYKNYAYIAGQGEGVDRRVVSTGVYRRNERYEMFVDARDVEDEVDEVPRPPQEITNELLARGKDKLQEHEQEVYLEGQALMGRVTEKIPTEITGSSPEVTLNIQDLETLFLSHFQTAEEIEVPPVYIKPIKLSSIGRYRKSEFTWDTVMPTGTSAFVEISFDNVNWSLLKNGEGLPFEEGQILKETLYIRLRLATIDQNVIPSIINFAYKINGYRIRELISTAGLQYEKDYDLGDIVTLQNKDWGVTLDTRITEVKEIYEPGGMKIELTFGNNRPTLIDKIKQELSGMKKEITR